MSAGECVVCHKGLDTNRDPDAVAVRARFGDSDHEYVEYVAHIQCIRTSWKPAEES